MDDNWHVTQSLIKNYPHFDAPLSPSEIEAIVKSPQRVESNAFFPFMRYFERWQPFRICPDGKPPKKERPIRYASRRDAYIFSYYRWLLSKPYELKLEQAGVFECPIAYRKLRKGASSRGKCNIDFAKDVFDEIIFRRNCIAISLDISSFFESLDHRRLFRVWGGLLGERSLPRDHLQVFKHVTRYHYVDQHEVYLRLGYIHKVIHNGRERYVPTCDFDNMPKQLCTPDEFRTKIAGKAPDFSNIICKNTSSFGVPQGSPIADLLANAYLFEFDKEIHGYAQRISGFYRRYSDDIVLVIPDNINFAQNIVEYLTERLTHYGDALTIKSSKTSIVRYSESHGRLSYDHIQGPQGKNGFEYLGFRFDGNKVFLRDATIARFKRKISTGARHAARKHILRYPGKNLSFLLENFDYSNFMQRYGRVENFSDCQDDYRSWTFWTYARRASITFGDRGSPIIRQISGYKRQIRDRVGRAIRGSVDART